MEWSFSSIEAMPFTFAVMYDSSKGIFLCFKMSI
jgi:hypothetical protein